MDLKLRLQDLALLIVQKMAGKLVGLKKQYYQINFLKF